jgi:hypothetical protein
MLGTLSPGGAHEDPLTRFASSIALLGSLAGCGSGTMILYNAQTGECDEMPKAMAYAMGGGLFARLRAWTLGGARGSGR